MQFDIRHVGLAPNTSKPGAVQLTSKIVEFLGWRGIRCSVHSEAAEQLGMSEIAASEEQLSETDMLIILGGDGTMLRWCRIASPNGVPLLGINFGQYGFINEVQPENTEEALGRILDGKAGVSERVVLKAIHETESGENKIYYGLNDVVVSKGPQARLLDIDTHVGNNYLATYAADGIIVCSPTGSTAYSLSAGGPVVYPGVKVLIITPICPHTLNERSLVIPDNQEVKIQSHKGIETDMVLTIDGQEGAKIGAKDSITVGKAEFSAKLIQMEANSFYKKLQTRLRWGERFTD